jgi:hypothetical protein
MGKDATLPEAEDRSHLRISTGALKPDAQRFSLDSRTAPEVKGDLLAAGQRRGRQL